MRSEIDLKDNLGYMRRTIEVLGRFGIEPSKEMNAVINTLKWALDQGQTPIPNVTKDVACVHGKPMSKCEVCGQPEKKAEPVMKDAY